MAQHVPPAPMQPSAQTSPSAALDDALYARTLTWSDAQRLAQQPVRFMVPAGEQALAVDMLILQTEQKPSASPHMQQFSLVFRGPRAPLLAQRTYRMRHGEWGDWAVFITPIAQTVDHTDYEACFSHGA